MNGLSQSPPTLLKHGTGGGPLPQQLPEAVQRFCDSTQEAQRAFDALSLRVTELKAELEITNRKLRDKNKELDHLNGHLVSLLDSLSDGVIALDSGAVIRLMNPAAEQLTARRGSDWTGRTLFEWLPENHTLRSMARSALNGKGPTIRHRAQLPRPGKDPLPIAAAAAPVKDRNGVTIGAVLVMQDLEELVGLQEEVRRTASLAAIGRMAAVVAHEIRNPLGGVEGFATLLQSAPGLDEEKRRYTEMILSGIKDLNRLVDSLLNFSRPPELELQGVDLKELIPEVVALMLADPHTARGILAQETSLNMVDAVIMGDRGALKQVFLNLVKNAQEAMFAQGGGALRVRIGPGTIENREAIVVEVADTGPGIAPTILDKIFEPFITTKQKGTGLGLPTVAKLVQAHGGIVECLDEIGGGCCFRVTLPKAIEFK